MGEVILQIIMMGGSFIAGYCVRALTHPEQKRDKKGRFTKD